MVATDLTQRLWAKNKHYGWIPRARVVHANGEATFGGEWREADGRRFLAYLQRAPARDVFARRGFGLPQGKPFDFAQGKALGVAQDRP